MFTYIIVIVFIDFFLFGMHFFSVSIKKWRLIKPLVIYNV